MLQSLIAPNVSVPDMSKFIIPVSPPPPPIQAGPDGVGGPVPQGGTQPNSGVMDPNGSISNAPIQGQNKSIQMGDIEQQGGMHISPGK
jgi:hypothetical protein